MSCDFNERLRLEHHSGEEWQNVICLLVRVALDDTIEKRSVDRYRNEDWHHTIMDFYIWNRMSIWCLMCIVQLCTTILRGCAVAVTICCSDMCTPSSFLPSWKGAVCSAWCVSLRNRTIACKCETWLLLQRTWTFKLFLFTVFVPRNSIVNSNYLFGEYPHAVNEYVIISWNYGRSVLFVYRRHSSVTR